MRVLAFESSCDECSVSVLNNSDVVSLITHTQSVHADYGGVVPELAGRSHLELIDGLCCQALREADCTLDDIELVAATSGPGLVGSLLVGFHYAQAIALGRKLPFRQMHHMEAHLWSAEIESGDMPLPFVVLLVSGGHTLLVLVRGLREYEILGSTLDDALGEAYDKIGKLLGLPFPAGAAIDRLAADGDPNAFEFPRSLQDDSLNFSYSGLKTSVRYKLTPMNDSQRSEAKADVLASFQAAALDSTVNKIALSIGRYAPRALVAAGGVSANSVLRRRLSGLAKENDIPCFVPPLKYCADNAAMVGYLAGKLQRAGVDPDSELSVRPRWSLTDLCEQAVRP